MKKMFKRDFLGSPVPIKASSRLFSVGTISVLMNMKIIVVRIFAQTRVNIVPLLIIINHYRAVMVIIIIFMNIISRSPSIEVTVGKFFWEAQVVVVCVWAQQLG